MSLMSSRRKAAWVALVAAALMWVSAIQIEKEEPGTQYPMGDLFLVITIALAVGLVVTRSRGRGGRSR